MANDVKGTIKEVVIAKKCTIETTDGKKHEVDHGATVTLNGNPANFLHDLKPGDSVAMKNDPATFVKASRVVA